MIVGFLMGLILVYAIVYSPISIALFLVPNWRWLGLAAAVLGTITLYKGLSALEEPCGNSLMVYAIPEPSDDWLAAFLVVVLTAILRGLTLLSAGWLRSVGARLGLGIFAMLVFPVLAHLFLHALENGLTFARCAEASARL